MRTRLFVVALVLTLLAITALSASAAGFGLGDSVKVVGKGYHNPDCTGLTGVLWDATNNKEYFLTCSISVPSSGTGTIAANSEGGWLINGNYRVCTPKGCGWYPANSLRRLATPKPAAPAKTTAPKPQSAPRQQQSCYYTVQEGDLFQTIAARYGFTVPELQKNNVFVTNPDLINIGLQLDVCRHPPG